MTRTISTTLIGLLTLCILLTSCDNDLKFKVITRAMYVLAYDSTLNQRELICFTPDKITQNYERTLGISVDGLSDIHVKNNVLWVADPVQKRVLSFAFDKNEASEKTEFTYDGFTPFYVAVGDKYFVASDTLTHTLVFQKLKNDDNVRIHSSTAPTQIFWKMGKFYVISGKNVDVYDESALSLRTQITFPHPVSACIPSHVSATVVLDSGQSKYIDLIDFNGDFAANKPFVLTNDKICNTPYVYTQYGSECLTNLYLSDKKLRAQNAVNRGSTPLTNFPAGIQDFEADFFSSQLYYLKGDTLYERGIAANTDSRQVFWKGNLLKGEARQGYVME